MCPINWQDILSISVTQTRNAHYYHHHHQLSNYVTGSQVTSFAIPPFCVVFWKNGLLPSLKPTPLQPPNGIGTSKPTNIYSVVLSNRSMWQFGVCKTGMKIETSHWQRLKFTEEKQKLYKQKGVTAYRWLLKLILIKQMRVCNMWWG